MRRRPSLLFAFLALATVATAPGRAAGETEPNDTCATADGPLLPDTDFTGEITAGDRDVVVLEVAPGACYTFETAPHGDLPRVDTILELFDATCDVPAMVDDDGGEDGYSRGRFTFATGGTYHVVVSAFSPSAAGHYVLRMPDDCPGNERCEGAIDLQEQGLAAFTVDLSRYVRDYVLVSGPCGDPPIRGADAVYAFHLDGGRPFSACVDDAGGGDCDVAISMMSDCAAPETTCFLASNDGNPECIRMQAAPAGDWYLVVASPDGCTAAVTVDGVLPTAHRTWTSVKDVYR